MLILVCLGDDVFRFIVRILTDPMQEGKAIAHGHTDLGTKLHSSSCFATNNGSNVPLDQIDDSDGHAARLGIQQDVLLAMKLTDHEHLPPPMGLQTGKQCQRSDQSVDGIKITL